MEDKDQDKHKHSHKRKKLSPEVDLALIFVGLFILLQVVLVLIILWNSHQNRKVALRAGGAGLEYRVVDDQYQRMQKQFVVVKTALETINSEMVETNDICKGQDPNSNENAIRLKLLKHKIFENQISLQCAATLVKLSYGDAESQMIQKYVADLTQRESRPAICAGAPDDLEQWQTKSQAITNQLTASLGKVSEKLEKILDKTGQGAK